MIVVLAFISSVVNLDESQPMIRKLLRYQYIRMTARCPRLAR